MIRSSTRQPPLIAHVTQPVSEGVGSAVLDQVGHQCSLGLRVAVACDAESDLASQVLARGAEVLHWRARRGIRGSTLRETNDLRRVLERARPALVHLHSSKAGMAGRLAVRSKVPTVFQPHGWSFLAVPVAAQQAAIVWERHASRWTTAAILVSEGERSTGERHRLLPGTDALVIPNSVDGDLFRPAEPDERSALRRALGVDEGPLVVSVGRLSHQKGHDRLLDAWPLVLDSVPDAQLAIVGDGPLRAPFEARASTRVTFTGARDDIADVLRAADLYVTASRWEGMSLAMLEAMACGLCVVATPSAGVAETVGAGAGIVTEADPSALASAISSRLHNRALAEQEGRTGRALALARHRPETAHRSILRLYTELTGSLLASDADITLDHQAPPESSPPAPRPHAGSPSGG